MSETSTIVEETDRSAAEKRFTSIEEFRREYFPQDFRPNEDNSEVQEIARQSAAMVRSALLS